MLFLFGFLLHSKQNCFLSNHQNYLQLGTNLWCHFVLSLGKQQQYLIRDQHIVQVAEDSAYHQQQP